MSTIIGTVGAAKASVASATAGGLMHGLLRAVESGMQIKSLADISKPLRVEPLVIIDKSIVNQPYMEDLMKLSLSQFAGYYLQAANMLLGIGRIDTLKVFDSLNPVRSIGGLEHHASNVFDSSQYSRGLPSLESYSKPERPGLIAKVSTESEASITATTPNGEKLYEVDSLAIGKLLNIEVQDPELKKPVKLPVLIRLIPAPIDSDIITHIFTAGGKQSWSHRLFLAKTGQIRMWRDLVLGMDIVDKHFSALVRDKTNTYAEINERRNNNLKKSIMTGRVSMADASNIAIVSTDTLREATNGLYGKIENASVRKAIFDNTYLLMLMVVDQYYSRVTVYHRGLDIPSTYRLDEVQAKERGKGQDITEIFKMFSKQMQTNI